MKYIVISLVIFMLAGLVQASEIVISNNHDIPVQGPISFNTSEIDGFYKCSDGGILVVENGKANGVVSLNAGQKLSYNLANSQSSTAPGLLSINPFKSGLKVKWGDEEIASLDFELFVSGSKLVPEDVVGDYVPAKMTFKNNNDVWSSQTEVGSYDMSLSAKVYKEGYIDFTGKITAKTSEPSPSSIVLVRHISLPEINLPKMRWNGRVLDTDTEPDVIDKDNHYSQGLDWMSWSVKSLRSAVVNNWTPALAALKKGKWYCSKNHFIYEKILHRNSDLYFLTLVEDSEDDKGVLQPGQTMEIHWRMAFKENPKDQWENGLLLAFGGCNLLNEDKEKTVFNFGTPFVKFGVSYHPYSTLTENFDFYRVKGLDREGWWAFSPEMWKQWKKFIPDMQRDLRIIKSMGFEIIRPHFCGHLRYLRRSEALEFLDWFMEECRKLEFRVLMDSEGEPEWLVLLATRYEDLIDRYELCNEIMLQASYRGLGAEKIEELKDAYNAIRKVCPDLPIHVTSNGSTGIFEQARHTGLPFDGYGVHYYRHGPGWLDILESQSLGSGTYASRLGIPALLTEFNWKNFTEMAPPERLKYVTETYDRVLKVRAFPEVYLFHFHETMSPNPRLGRNATRHYEVISLDRRPKPTFESWMKQMYTYASPDLPFMQLQAVPEGVILKNNKTVAQFSVSNMSDKELNVTFSPECFNELNCRIKNRKIKIDSGEKYSLEVELSLPDLAEPGVYHYFIRTEFNNEFSYLWGWAELHGKPVFDKSLILPEHVVYPQGNDVVNEFDFNKPVTVVFAGDTDREKRDARNVEMAYLIYNTLRTSTGKSLYLCSDNDIPGDRLENGNLILIGKPQDFDISKFKKVEIPYSGEKGIIYMAASDNGEQWLCLTGHSPASVEAASIDFLLRYWKNSKNSAINRIGMEEGNMLGNSAETGLLNPP